MICQKKFTLWRIGIQNKFLHFVCFAEYVYHLCIVEYYARAPLLTSNYKTGVPGS